MENITLNTATQVVEYQTLVDTLKDLQTCKDKLEDYFHIQNKSFSELEMFLTNWEMSHDYDTIVEDINVMLSNPIFTDNVLPLQEELRKVKGDVDFLEILVKRLEKLYEELRQKPDRHGKKEATQYVEELFNNTLRKIHIAQIHQTIDKTIPSLNSIVQTVLNALEKENDQRAININLVNELLKRITIFRGYADKFNSRNICASCESRINPIKQESRVDPVADKKVIDQVQQELDGLQDAYDEEQEQFDELEEEIENKLEYLWEEDYDEKFSSMFDNLSCMVESTIEDLRSLYEEYKERKRKDIRQVEIQYGNMTFPRGEKIMEHFRSELDSIRVNHVSKRKLDDLISRIDNYVTEKRRNILKMAGIPLCLVALIVNPVLGGLIGIIVAILWFRDRKK